MTQKIEINKKYRTRGGKPVRLTEVTKESRYPVKGFVEGDIHPFTWMIDGTFDENGETSLDLIEIVEEPVCTKPICSCMEFGGKRPTECKPSPDPSELLKEAVGLLRTVLKFECLPPLEGEMPVEDMNDKIKWLALSGLHEKISQFLTKHSGRV